MSIKNNMSIKRTLETMDDQIENTIHLIERLKEKIVENPEDKLSKRELKSMEMILNCQQSRRAAVASQLFTK